MIAPSGGLFGKFLGWLRGGPRPATPKPPPHAAKRPGGRTFDERLVDDDDERTVRDASEDVTIREKGREKERARPNEEPPEGFRYNPNLNAAIPVQEQAINAERARVVAEEVLKRLRVATPPLDFDSQAMTGLRVKVTGDDKQVTVALLGPEARSLAGIRAHTAEIETAFRAHGVLLTALEG